MLRRLDEKSGYYYLENVETGETKWEDIPLQLDMSSSTSSGSSGSDYSSTASEGSESDGNEFQDIKNPPSSSKLGLIPLLIPGCGLPTIFVLITWSCITQFDCKHDYPTLSHAASFRPQGIVFMIGMCLTAGFIQTTTLLFAWQLQLQLSQTMTKHKIMKYGILLWGTLTACGLFILAIFDMKNHHDIHVNATVIFFISAWIVITCSHIARSYLHQNGWKGREDIHLEKGDMHLSYHYGLWFIRIGVGASIVCTS